MRRDKIMAIVKQLLLVLVVLCIGGLMGFTIASKTMAVADNCQIYYVAEDELMALENDRVKAEAVDLRQLFFGKIAEAVRLAAEMPQAYQNRTTKVVYSMSSIVGPNVKSISKEIHRQIIEKLSKEGALLKENHQ